MIDFKKVEEEVLKFWEDNKIYEKVKEKNKDGKKFYFLQGPPYTSGKLHIGHAWNNSLKDIILRYKRLRGFNVWDRGGFDMHGLPTSQKVQKNLGLKNKDDILEFGVDNFIKECLKFSNENVKFANDDLWKLGIWMDHKNAYKTPEKSYIGGQWAFFKKAWEQNRLYEGQKVMHWDSETETSLAKHELEYKTIKDKSVFLKFKKENSENEYFVIWTTTPWTIPFNLAIMVNPELDYVKVKVDNDGKEEFWIVADALAGAFISGLLGKKLEIVEKFKGVELEGQRYEHPFQKELKESYEVIKNESPKTHSIILSKEHVDTTAGTGLVHCAPGCGPEDYEVGKKYGIIPFNNLNERGEFENAGKYTGWKAKEDDFEFIKEFEEKGILVAKTIVEHEYPHSDRSRKPVIFRTTKQWFLKTKDLVDDLLKFNKEVYWVPKKWGDNFDRWTENLRDNGITRQRFWGCPVPIWINEEDSEDFFVVGSVGELESLSGKKFDDLTIHKPFIDEIIIEKDGKKYKRIPDVSDVWIDSGTASWNCLYNDSKLISEWFPADFVLEATEQTRLWFSLLQICSAIRFGKTSYKNVYAHGMILDFEGLKMSKSLGNVISPYEVIDKYSVDIMRNYLCGVSAGENISFSWEDIKVKRRNLMMLSNIGNYILDLEKQKNNKGGKVGIEEKWILSKYNSTLKKITKLFENYKLDDVIPEIENLFILLSRDYIKYVRDKAMEDKIVLGTVKKIYLEILKMFSPICPFVTEDLWAKMEQKEKSVHLTSWTNFDEEKIDLDLEKEFEAGRKVIERGLRERDRNQIGLKWPLKKAKIKCDVPIREDILEIVKKQLNVKSLDFKFSEKDIEVSLDLNMTPELEAEGFSREIARRVQAERKKRGMQKTERINLELFIGSDLRKGIEKYKESIGLRTGADTVVFTDDKKADFIDFKVRKVDLSFGF